MTRPTPASASVRPSVLVCVLALLALLVGGPVAAQDGPIAKAAFVKAGVAAAKSIFAKVPTEQRVPLQSCAVWNIPAGYFRIQRAGPFIILQAYNNSRQQWENTQANQATTGISYSTGSNFRLVNPTNCVTWWLLKAGGTGYTASNPPTATLSTTMANGKTTNRPVGRGIVGGAIVATVVSGGTYDFTPTVIFDYSKQTPPFREAQLDPRLDVNGHITGFNYDSPPANGSTAGPSGAGLDASKLTIKIVRNPEDTQTDNAVVTLANDAGTATSVTAVDSVTYGGAYGNNTIQGQEVITHNGGSGFTANAVGNNYITTATINDAGLYLNAYSDRGASSGSNTVTSLNDTTKAWTANQWAGYYVRVLDGPAQGEVGLIASNTATALTISGQKAPTTNASWSITPGSAAYEIASGVTSSTANNTYLAMVVSGGFLWDEVMRPPYVNGVGVLTNGLLTSTSQSGMGPNFQSRPVATTVPGNGIATVARPAQVVLNFNTGSDYATVAMWPGS